MDNIKNDRYYASKILKDIKFLMKHTKDLTEEEFDKDEVLLDSIMFRFIQITENIKSMSAKFRNDHRNIPWTDIIGFRNKIVHEYGKVDLKIVYDTIKIDLIELEQLFSELVEN